MATVTKRRLKLGPKDHDRALSYDEFMAADYQPGHKYEIIDGRLYVSPLPKAPEERAENWLFKRLYDYYVVHPEIINYISGKTCVFVSGRPGVTVPEPDIAAYDDYPLDLPFAEVRWQDLRPILVVEVLTRGDPHKDLVRNVELYLQVPSIKEYWILDTRSAAERPTLMVYRRHGKRWRTPLQYNHGETYTTKLLPGFELLIDPRR